MGVGEEGEGDLLERGRACWGPTPEEEGEKGWRVGGSGFWHTLRSPLPPISHLHPFSPPQINTLVVSIPGLWCLSLLVGVTVFLGADTHIHMPHLVSCILTLPSLGPALGEVQ